jgi:hypothetical protein
MAKYGKKQFIGAVKKAKDKNKPDYIQISKDVELKQGSYLNLEKPQDLIAGLKEASEAGKLSEDTASDLIAKYEKDIKFGTRFVITYQEKLED